MTKRNYVATAMCDGVKKHYTVRNVTKGRATEVAKSVGKALFYASCVSIIELIIVK